MHSTTPENPESPPRRSFLKKLTAGILGGLISVVPGLAGLMVILDPLKRKSTGGDNEVLVARLAALPDDGIPRRFSVIMDKVDAWNTYKNIPVGGVFLRRAQDGTITALNAACPHAGCSVAFGGDSKEFICPCHDSSFAVDGEIANDGSPSPRGLDSLEVEVRNGNEIWVKFLNFQAGHKEKIPVV
mgnify:CR=1 FL=1